MNRSDRRRAQAQARATKADTPTEFWHTRHSCGHSAYWSDMTLAFTKAAFPCPWCGAMDGKKAPEGAMVIYKDGSRRHFVFREKLPDGSVPGMPSSLIGSKVRLNHLADETCCGGSDAD